MPPFSVIPALYILKYRQFGLPSDGKFPMVDQFRFHRFEETFGYGIVPTVSFPAYIFEGSGRILQAYGYKHQ
jgi:hypothetical protein